MDKPFSFAAQTCIMEPSTGKESTAVPDMFNTTKLSPIQESGNEAQDILMYVYHALQAKGYDPITQIVGYIISGDQN